MIILTKNSIAIALVILTLFIGGGTFFYFKPMIYSTPVIDTASLDKEIVEEQKFRNERNYAEIWNRMHPDDQTLWADKEEYIQKRNRVPAPRIVNPKDVKVEIRAKDILPVWLHPITQKTYSNVVRVTEAIGDGIGTTTIYSIYQSVDGVWKFFSSSISKKAVEMVKQSKSQFKSPPYKEVVKEPVKYLDERAGYTGTVIQINSSNGTGWLNLDTAGHKYNSDIDYALGLFVADTITVLFYGVDDADLIKRGDTATIYGALSGSVTIELSSGQKITTPKMLAFLVEKQNTPVFPVVEKQKSPSVKQTQLPAESKPTTPLVATPQPAKPSVYCSVASDCNGFNIKIDFDEDIESCAATYSCNYSNKVLQTKQIYYVIVRGDTVGGEVKSKNLNSGTEADYEDITFGSYNAATGEIDFTYGYYLYPNIKVDFVSISHTGKIIGNEFVGDYKYSGSLKETTRGRITYLPISVSDYIPRKNCSIKGDEFRISGGQKTYYLSSSVSYSQVYKAQEWFCVEEDAIKAGYKKALQ